MLSDEMLLARSGNFTASQNHRLMAGWDKARPNPYESYYQPLYDYIKEQHKDGRRDFLVGDMKSEQPSFDINGKIIKSVYENVKFDLSQDEPTEGAITYAEEKALESLFDIDPSLNFSTVHTRNGEEREVEAMEMLIDKTGLPFTNIGDDQVHIHNNEVGATPDGVVRDELDLINTGAEVKCKSPVEHARLWQINNNTELRDNAFEFYVQIQTQMLVTQTDYWYFAIYNPYAKHDWLKFKHIQIDLDKPFIAILEHRLAMAKKVKHDYLDTIKPAIVEVAEHVDDIVAVADGAVELEVDI